MFPHSPHDDAWGVTRVPIAVIANDAGPTVIIEGGNHGDEYEGPIVIGELARDLDPGRLQGRLILMPAVNTPAVTASRRTSPIDRLNFNRTFPGDPAGALTQYISAYVADYIFPMGDAFLDLHSGGSSPDFIPSAVIQPTEDKPLAKRNTAAALVFDAPATVVVPNLGDQRPATASACRAGLVTVGTELAGGGRESSEAPNIFRCGVRNVLVHHGVLDGELQAERPSDKAILELRGTAAYVYAPSEGLLETFHPLGANVSAGEPSGQIHRVRERGHAPDTISYNCHGTLLARGQPGRVKPGNCCFVVASPVWGMGAKKDDALGAAPDAAQSQLPAAATPLRVLVAGIGAFGAEHLARLAGRPDIIVSGIADIDAAALERAGSRSPLARRFADSLRLIEEVEADAIVVATPAATHVEIGIKALERNLCALIEKPVVPSAAAVVSLLAVARSSAGFVLPGHVLRFSQDHLRLVEVARSGLIGQVLYVNSRRYRDDSHAVRYADADPILTTLIHDIDIAQWIARSEFRSVLARRSGEGYRSLTAISATTATGVVCDLRSAWTFPGADLPPDCLEAVGDRGSVELTVGNSLRVYAEGRCKRHKLAEADDPLRNEQDHFLVCVRDRSRARALDLPQAIAGLKLADAALESLHLNREVTLAT